MNGAENKHLERGNPDPEKQTLLVFSYLWISLKDLDMYISIKLSIEVR